MRSTILVIGVTVCLGSFVSNPLAQTCELQRGVPCPAQSTIEPFIIGNTSGAAMYHRCPPGSSNLCSGYKAIVKDFQGTPVQHAKIRVRFPSSNLRALTIQTGMSVNCGGDYIETTAGTTGTGSIVFQPRFGGTPVLYALEVEILAVTSTHTISLGWVQARSTDYVAGGGCGLGDFAAFSGYYLKGELLADLDTDWVASLYDLTQFTTDYNASVNNPACP